jgi:hypothetical protein
MSRLQRICAVVLGAVAILVGALLVLIVVWSAIHKQAPRLLLNDLFPTYAVIMGIYGMRYAQRRE